MQLLDTDLYILFIDSAVRVIILRGNGEHFSSGHDLGSKAHLDDLQRNSYESMGYPGPEGDYKKWSDTVTVFVFDLTI